MILTLFYNFNPLLPYLTSILRPSKNTPPSSSPTSSHHLFAAATLPHPKHRLLR